MLGSSSPMGEVSRSPGSITSVDAKATRSQLYRRLVDFVTMLKAGAGLQKLLGEARGLEGKAEEERTGGR